MTASLQVNRIGTSILDCLISFNDAVFREKNDFIMF